jgi:hypothetical protein
MKNIHVLQENIYITNSEEIKAGDYYIHNNKVRQSADGEQEKGDYKNCKKVILTTDPELIKNGVQAIDDYYLEWFVKNPSCEEVEIQTEKVYNKIGDSISYYKTIIPKEEDKQQCCENTNGFNLGTTCPYCKKPFRNVIKESKKENTQESAVEWLYERLERMIPRTALYDIDKREYIQQAKEMENKQEGYSKEDLLESFIDGYKFRAEASDLIFDNASRMYAIHIFNQKFKNK